MGDCVSPVVELTKTFLPDCVSLIDLADDLPKLKSKSVEVGTQVAGRRVASVELSMKQKLSTQNNLQRGRLDDLKQVVDALGM